MANDYEVSTEQEIAQLTMKRPHVVLLGAGASRAAFPNGDLNGKHLPLMRDFTEIVPVGEILRKAGFDPSGTNFEEIYSALAIDPRRADTRLELEESIYAYFDSLQLPREATLYDRLILSLRGCLKSPSCVSCEPSDHQIYHSE